VTPAPLWGSRRGRDPHSLATSRTDPVAGTIGTA
jgi:hypothetical protein